MKTLLLLLLTAGFASAESLSTLSTTAREAYARGDKKMAKRYARRAITQSGAHKKDPDYAATIYNCRLLLGEIALDENKPEKAEQELKLSLEKLKTFSGPAEFTLVERLWKLERKDAVRAHLARMKALWPEAPAAPITP